jgi:hypothetical protein
MNRSAPTSNFRPATRPETPKPGTASNSWTAVDGRPVAILAVADPVRENSPAAVRALRALGLRAGRLGREAGDVVAEAGHEPVGPHFQLSARHAAGDAEGRR